MVTLNSDGTLTFRLYAPNADHVELLGDFTRWEHGRMNLNREVERQFVGTAADAPRVDEEPSGWWSIRVHLPAGDHAFCYLVNGHCWMPDYAATGVKRNEFGNWVSLISVRARTATPEAGRTASEAGEYRSARHPARGRELARLPDASTIRESWRIEGCCDAEHPWS